MNNESNIKALMQLVKESVENKSLSKDYGSLLDICRKSNISSYTLNVLIEGAVSSVNSDKDLKHVQSLPCFGWSPAVIQQSETSAKMNHGRNVPIQNRMLLTKKPMRVRRYFCPKHSARQSKPAYPRKSVVKQMST